MVTLYALLDINGCMSQSIYHVFIDVFMYFFLLIWLFFVVSVKDRFYDEEHLCDLGKSVGCFYGQILANSHKNKKSDSGPHVNLKFIH